MALAGVELEALVFETDALTTRPPPCANTKLNLSVCTVHCNVARIQKMTKMVTPTKVVRVKKILLQFI